MKQEKYCPTQNGKFVAYKPQYRRNSEGSWRDIPIAKINSLQMKGLPFPKQFGGIISTINLGGYSQSKALMWAWSALHEAEGLKIETRLEEYEVDYQIKARKIAI